MTLNAQNDVIYTVECKNVFAFCVWREPIWYTIQFFVYWIELELVLNEVEWSEQIQHRWGS